MCNVRLLGEHITAHTITFCISWASGYSSRLTHVQHITTVHSEGNQGMSDWAIFWSRNGATGIQHKAVQTSLIFAVTEISSFFFKSAILFREKAVSFLLCHTIPSLLFFEARKTKVLLPFFEVLNKLTT